MTAPTKFCEWMSSHRANDHKFGRKVFRYHPRSDEHSKVLCRLVLGDLLAACPVLEQHALSRRVLGGTNVKHKFPNGKVKTLDLGLGVPPDSFAAPTDPAPLLAAPVGAIRVACEAKQCMTERGKTVPRLFDELSSAHEIVHQGNPAAIASGIVVINIASRYASPTRQRTKRGPLVVTTHNQPHAAESMVAHLRGLKMRDAVGEVGFDAFCIFIIDCDNTGPCVLHTDAPAPRPGDRDHYGTFIDRISRAYEDRFAG